MISLIICGLSLVLTFFFPLFLTYKALIQESTSKLQLTKVAHLHFLVNYWISYILLLFIENLFNHQLIMGLLHQNPAVVGFFFVIRLWLFFCQGCLVLNRGYGNIIASLFASQQHGGKSMRVSTRLSFEEFERVIDPICKSMMHSLSSVLRVSGGANFGGMAHRLVSFQEFMAKNAQLSFILSSLHFFCQVEASPLQVAEDSKPSGFSNFIRATLAPANTIVQQPQQKPLKKTTAPPPVQQLQPAADIPVYSQLSQVKIHSNSTSRKASRSNSNILAEKFLLPERFSSVDFRDVPAFSRSPSPAPSLQTPPLPLSSTKSALPSHKLKIGDVHTPAQYQKYLDYQQKLKDARNTTSPPMPLQQQLQPQQLSQSLSVKRAMSEKMATSQSLRETAGQHLNAQRDIHKSRSIEGLDSEYYVVHETGQKIHLQPPTLAPAPDTNYIILPRRNRLVSQPPYPQ